MRIPVASTTCSLWWSFVKSSPSHHILPFWDSFYRNCQVPCSFPTPRCCQQWPAPWKNSWKVPQSCRCSTLQASLGNWPNHQLTSCRTCAKLRNMSITCRRTMWLWLTIYNQKSLELSRIAFWEVSFLCHSAQNSCFTQSLPTRLRQDSKNSRFPKAFPFPFCFFYLLCLVLRCKIGQTLL